MTKRDNSFEIRLRNADGVPILHVGGSITKTTLQALKSTLERLASAGHYHIVLNMERVQNADWDLLAMLGDSVRKVRSHYGAVDLVAAQETIKQLSGIDKLARMFRLARSESEAIGRIKRLNRAPDGMSSTNARLVEQS